MTTMTRTLKAEDIMTAESAVYSHPGLWLVSSVRDDLIDGRRTWRIVRTVRLLGYVWDSQRLMHDDGGDQRQVTGWTIEWFHGH